MQAETTVDFSGKTFRPCKKKKKFVLTHLDRRQPQSSNEFADFLPLALNQVNCALLPNTLQPDHHNTHYHFLALARIEWGFRAGKPA